MKMNRKITALMCIAVITAGVMSPHAGYADTEKTAVDYLSGYEDGQLHLERTLTRAEFAKMFSDVFLQDAPQTDDKLEFTDIKNDYWGSEYIQRAVKAGVISGFEDGSFRPEESITYEQALTVVQRYLEAQNIAAASAYLEYPQTYVAPAVECGIADGVTAVIGQKITRGDIVKMLDNTLSYTDEKKAYSEDLKREAEAMQKFYDGLSNSAASAPIAGGSGAAPGAVMMESSLMSYSDGGMYFDDYDDSNFNTEEYTSNEENVFKSALTSPLSTFSIDTDTASYSNMRRFILRGEQIPSGAIRTEELINYFDYDNPLPENGEPFALTSEVHECPWNSGNRLAKIAVQGAEMTERQPSNLVFLLDTSGSMNTENKLPLVKKSLKMLLDELDENDTVSIVTYASGTGVALDVTPVSEKEKILEAFDTLFAAGGTNGEGGINLAYEQAEKHLIDGNNRIILCTDGDFNIGVSSTGDLEKLIEEKRDKGIFLTVLGFGMGNYKDNRMETLADKGNGSYAYIDSEREAKKVFVDEMPKTLYTIAKDVKIQVEFNPELVKEYRLVGYENRVMNNEDFDNDKKDAGELGSGAAVTALYEIVPADGSESGNLKYQTAQTTGSDELMTVKVRYKDPDGSESKLLEMPVSGSESDGAPSENFCLAAAAAELGMILNNSEYKGTADFDSVIQLAKDGIGEDKFGFRTEFLHLVDLLRSQM